MKVFWWFFELVVYNALVVYNDNAVRDGRKKKSQLQHQKDLVKELCLGGVRVVDSDDGEDGDEERKVGRADGEGDEEEAGEQAGEDAGDQAGDHAGEQVWGGANLHPRTPVIDPPTRLLGGWAAHEQKQYPGRIRRRCRVCYKNGRRRESRYYCRQCNMPLCRDVCRDRYHTVQQYY